MADQGNEDWADHLLKRTRTRSEVAMPSTSANQAPSSPTDDSLESFEPTPASQERVPDDTDEPIVFRAEPSGQYQYRTPETEEVPPATRISSVQRSLLEWGAVVVAALLLALLVRTFLLGTYYIPTPSMEPTLTAGDRILVNKISYHLHDVNRGDLVVFEPPVANSSESEDLIKRVIGLPGETVTASEGRILIDGGLLIEPYLAWPEGTDDFGAVPWCSDGGAGTCLVPPDHVFVMGDNRPNSRDSRFFGPIPVDSIIGRAFFRYWPLRKLSRL